MGAGGTADPADGSPFIEVIYADGGYQGPKMAATVAKTGT